MFVFDYTPGSQSNLQMKRFKLMIFTHMSKLFGFFNYLTRKIGANSSQIILENSNLIKKRENLFRIWK